MAFSSTAPDWALKLTCSAGTWRAGRSESLLVSSSIYSFFVYGDPEYLYLAVMSIADGSISMRYKSSVGCNYLFGSWINGDYLVASACGNLLLFNKETNDFTIKLFSGSYLHSCVVEISTGR